MDHHDLFLTYSFRLITHSKTGGKLAWRIGPGKTCEIIDIDVPNEHRRTGVGRKMVFDLVNKVGPCDNRDLLAETIFAVTREDNNIACQFYLGCGFRISGVLRGFYPDGDAVCFVRRVG